MTGGIDWWKDSHHWVGIAKNKRRCFGILVRPEFHSKRRVFALSFHLPPRGFDTGADVRFATAKAAKAYATERYETWQLAEAAHRSVVLRVRNTKVQ
jgi:hypothetical protein